MNSANLFKWSAVVLGIPAAMLLVFTRLIVFLVVGGGFAYRGDGDCRFVLNPLGIAIVVGAAVAVIAFLYSAGRWLFRRHHVRQRRDGR